MSKNKKQVNETELLEKILDRLNSIDPPIQKIAVEPADPSMNMALIDLNQVCYITSKTDTEKRSETMYVMVNGDHHYNNIALKDLEEKLKDNPHFMRTSKFHIVNLGRITGFKYSAARDLWFEGHEDPVINCVSATYLAEFEKLMS